MDEHDPQLSICAIKKLREKEYRERYKNEYNIGILLIANLWDGFKIFKAYTYLYSSDSDCLLVRHTRIQANMV
jgi:hypothetical protein